MLVIIYFCVTELLPGIEEFLTATLEKEKLSILAEKKRKVFLERLEILRLPPSLPPRPDGKIALSQVALSTYL